MTNTQQIEYWNGETGQTWSEDAERYAQMLQPFGDLVLAAMQPTRRERILDVGCGNGDLSIGAARLVAPDGMVTGLDISGPMLENAKRRAAAAGVTNVQFQQGDAQVVELPGGSFDAVCSRFGVMFFDDPTAAFTNMARLLRRGGRIAFACWRDLMLNEYVMLPAAAALEHVPVPNLDALQGPGPYSLADPDDIRRMLTAAGFQHVEVAEADAQIFMGSTVDDVTAFFRRHEFAAILFHDAPPEAQDRAWIAIAEALRGRLTEAGISLAGAAWLVTATTNSPTTQRA